MNSCQSSPRQAPGRILGERLAAPFLLIALPWYVLCRPRNGRAFLDVFFWQQAALALATASVVTMLGPARRGANSDPREALRAGRRRADSLRKRERGPGIKLKPTRGSGPARLL